MHWLYTKALAAALSLVLLSSTAPASASSELPRAAEEARNRLARSDAPGAVEILEAALPSALAADRPALLDALRDAYTAAVQQAESEGKKDDADSYRENLEILQRKPRSAPAPAPAAPVATPAPAPTPPAAAPIPLPVLKDPAAAVAKVKALMPRPIEPADASEPLPPLPAAAPLAEPPVLPAPEPRAEPAPADQPRAAIPLPIARVSETIPKPAPAPEAAPAKPSLKSADQAFAAGRYGEAGEVYAAYHRDGALPANRQSHWAYCRAVEVVRKINARPASPAEWAAIDAEIQKIRALSPSNWFAEYLRTLAAERGRDPRKKSAAANKVVVRGSSPEEPPLTNPGSMTPAAPMPAQAPQQPPAPASQVPWSRQPIESANFIVIHVERDRELAESAAQAAEAARDASMKRWGAANVAWTPKCEIVIFPSAREFSRETLQPADSPGFSTMGMNEGRITLRRVHLRADHPTIVKAILPHEVTHVVLADLFPTQQIPRWADEGMAVLAEPHSEQSRRAADLDEPLRLNRLFNAGDLMGMDYPKPEFWALYYAQSVSLTRYLVETGTPVQFVRFVQQSQRIGFEPALQQVYSISGYADLQNRWLTYARSQAAGSPSLTASSEDSEKNPTAARE